MTIPSKYDYIDNGIVLVIPTGDLAPNNNVFTSPVSNLIVTPNVSWNGVTNITRLQVTWDSNATTYADKFRLIWSKDGTGINSITDLLQPAYDIENPLAGNYLITVIAINGISNIESAPVSITYAYKLGGLSTLVPPINPKIVGTSGLISNSLSLDTSWDYNTTNDSVVDKLLDYKIEVYDETPTTVKATYSVKPNVANKNGTFSLTYLEVQDIFGAKPRKITWRVYSRDTFGDLSGTYLEFTTENPVPAAQTFSVTPLEKAVKVSIDVTSDTDGIGYRVYTSLTSGGSRTLVYEGVERIVTIPQEAIPPVLKYYTVDAFDMLGTSSLLTSAEHSATANTTTATAVDISNTAAGNISSTNVQAAINELDSEKEAVINKVVAFSTPTDTQYPSAKLVSDTFANYLPLSSYHLYYRGKYISLAALNTAIPTASAGDYAQVDTGTGSDVVNYNWDNEAGWVIGSSGSGAVNTDSLPEGSVNLYWTNARTIAALLTGFTSGAGTVGSSDSILGAIQKLVGNLALKLTANTAITGATKTKITYDANGLITAGSDATTADIADSTNKRYITDAQQTILGNTSGTNTGDETLSSIKTKLGITTLSGSNTGDQTITLTGDVTGSGTGSFSATVGNSAVIGKVLTGLSAAVGTLAATDTLLQAFGKLAGLVDNDAWISWTPTFTNFTKGNATIDAHYKQIGKTVFYRLSITLGSTSSMSTSPTFSLPVTANFISGGFPIGSGRVNNSVARPCEAKATSSTAALLVFYSAATNYDLSITATAPETWTTGHSLQINGFYETV